MEDSRLRHLRGQSRTLAVFAVGALASLAAILLYNAANDGPEGLTGNEIDEAMAQAVASATPPRAVSAEVYDAILPSLVIIQTESANPDAENDFGLGGGVIINTGADILSALHVVEDATEILVRFADGTQSHALVVAKQPENDIAVLAPIDPPAVFLPATLGSSGALRVGDQVFAVGNPLGLVGSMTAGVVSGLDSRFTPAHGDRAFGGLIQFDAAVNPGSSGGPLLNRLGQVVGIVTALANPTEEEVFIGIGFAVPINTAAAAAGGPEQ